MSASNALFMDLFTEFPDILRNPKAKDICKNIAALNACDYTNKPQLENSNNVGDQTQNGGICNELIDSLIS
jgi:hypothetical protein